MSQSGKKDVQRVSLLTEKPKGGFTKDAPHKLSKIGKVIGVISGKGGVGKSMVTALSAVSMQRKGYRTAVLDADITGPSMPQYFGLTGKADATHEGLLPKCTPNGIAVMSVNLLLDDIRQPVVWRGPVVSNMVEQFWTEVIWRNIDYMFVDMPPGTGDVALTTFQSLPVDGIVVVTSPQELVSMIVAKAVNMAKKMHVPIIGIVENMAYFECDDCHKKHYIFGESTLNAVARDFNLPIMARIPIQAKMAELCDRGEIESYRAAWLDEFGDALQNMARSV